MNFDFRTLGTEVNFRLILRFAFWETNETKYLKIRTLTFQEHKIHPTFNAGFEPFFVMNLECVATQNAKRRIVTGRGIFS